MASGIFSLKLCIGSRSSPLRTLLPSFAPEQNFGTRFREKSKTRVYVTKAKTRVRDGKVFVSLIRVCVRERAVSSFVC